MSELKLTNARRDLLLAVGRGEVTRHWPLRAPGYDYWHNRRTRVTKRITELENAGLVRMAPVRMGEHAPKWDLTVPGRKVLDGAS